MELQLYGINHKTSNVSEREKFIINESNQKLLDSFLKERFGDKFDSFFGISTLTTGIYNSWLSFDDLAFANQLSFFLLIFILGLFFVENISRKRAKYHSPLRGGFRKKKKIKLKGLNSYIAFLFCGLVFFLLFV